MTEPKVDFKPEWNEDRERYFAKHPHSMSELFTCPKCGGGEFREYAYNETLQHGVRIKGTAERFEPDYEEADTIELLDNFKLLSYECETCNAELIVEEGKLKLREVK